ncbi:hypothetical protein pb186bvf_014081 [Paramecium bursaria]
MLSKEQMEKRQSGWIEPNSQESDYLNQRREMLFLSLQQIFLRSTSILTCLQWMQPPVSSNSNLKSERKYLKAVKYSQDQGHLDIVPEKIFIIEIERFLKILQYDNKEITLKILFEICSQMRCHIQQGRQEYVLYDKFFAYLHHHFNTQQDYVYLSEQSRSFLRKQKLEKSSNRVNELGIRRIGLITGECSQHSQLSDIYYNSYTNLNLVKPNELANYKFQGFQINQKHLNAIYGDPSNNLKLYLRAFPINNLQQDDIIIKETQIINQHQFTSNKSLTSQHQQTNEDEELLRIEYEIEVDQNEQEFQGGVELNFNSFLPNTQVQYQVYSVNSEVVAGIKISFPQERLSFPLITFPCIEPQEGHYDCHTFTFRPISNILGIEIEKYEQMGISLIKNFIFLAQDHKDTPLMEYKFDFTKNEKMEDLISLHDWIIPYFNDDFRQVKFIMYTNFYYLNIEVAKHIYIEDKLKKINLVIGNMFPQLDIVENKKQLIKPYVFEIYTIGTGRIQHRDNFNRYIFLQLESWDKIDQFNEVMQTLIDNILIFIWGSGGPQSIQKMETQVK